MGLWVVVVGRWFDGVVGYGLMVVCRGSMVVGLIGLWV